MNFAFRIRSGHTHGFVLDLLPLLAGLLGEFDHRQSGEFLLELRPHLGQPQEVGRLGALGLVCVSFLLLLPRLVRLHERPTSKPTCVRQQCKG